MKLRYLGHASFELLLGDGRKVVFDPYEAGSYNGAVGFAPITGNYDIAIVSHDHPDHRCRKVVDASRAVIDCKGEKDIDDVRIVSLETSHDESGGSERGKNLISVVEAEGVRLAHLGDLGHPIKLEDFPELRGVDVLLIPVGGFFTIDAGTAAEIAREIGPSLTVPMHYKNDKIDFPIATVDGFVSLMGGAQIAGTSEIEITKDKLAGPARVAVLDPAM